MKVSFILNARDKVKHVRRAVEGALSQTYTCEILLSDQSSADGTYEEMQRAVADFRMPTRQEVNGTEIIELPFHEVKLLRCPITGPYSMRSCNQHLQWLVEQASGEWVFQCSADDYSMPERVSVCMKALADLNNRGLDTVGLATTMKFDAPGKTEHGAVSGYPRESGYVSAGVGIHRLAYGSTIWGYRRDWLLKVGLDVPCTLDVYLGYLASLDRGYYVIANPQHVHCMAASLDNMGFQGKMRAAEESGDKELIARLNELNRFQLFECYYLAAKRQSELYPMAKPADTQAMIQMLINQSIGWYLERDNLHKHSIRPDLLWA